MAGIFDDAAFNSVNYDSYSNVDSPFDASRFFNLGPDSPDYQPRTPSKSFLDQDITSASQGLQQHPRSIISSRSTESSGQDSSSESSVRRKRKTTSESPPTENLAGLKMDSNILRPMPGMNMEDMHNMQVYGRQMNNMSLDQDMVSGNMDMNTAFDFDSAASSPGAIDSGVGTFNSHHAAMKNAMLQSGPPSGTVEPAQFFMGSTGASPNSAQANATAEGSPAVFSSGTPSSGPPDMFTTNAQMWGASGQAANWANDFGNSYASPGALGLTPSPVTKPRTVMPSRPAVTAGDEMIPLHIGAIPAKSRVETQINIRMTVDRLPPGISNLHLPTHTIAKAKLLNKDIPAPEATLELHTMLVCTSAMNQDKYRERALKKAASQDNNSIQARGANKEEIKNEEEEVSEDDKPVNGGEVRICQNCINRERKRAARKKLKKEEEQAHWEKYETERVIVFNTNEYKAWLDWQQSPPPKDGSLNPAPSDLYAPTDTAMQISAPMRIACYCRHHNEKDGFQVIFTLKDYTGKVVAQAVSDSILITDDHKTHPMSAVTGQVWYDGQFPSGGFGSQSMVDLHSHASHMPLSKSTGNLQSMAFGQTPGFHQSSSVHQLPAYASQTTSGTMTPRNLSRPASPTGLGQAGPSKKRKSSSTHRRVPSGLTMTKVDTSQPMSNAGTSAVASTPFSPTSMPGFTPDSNGSFMTMPNSRSRTSFHTQPSTPSDGTPFYRNIPSRTTSLDQQNFQAFYSAPNSAHQSRAASPVLQGPNLAAFQRQQGRPGFGLSGPPTSAPPQPSIEADAKPHPIINKVVPAEGSTAGGIEVSIYGQNFSPGMEVMFGDQRATATTYWGEKALCCVLPPSMGIGLVHVSIAGHSGNRLSGHAPGTNFRYTPDTSDVRMMEMALRFYSLKMTGTEDNWQSTAQDAANLWLSEAAASRDAGNGAPNMPGAFPGS
ncbi:hypothetical protein K461DRAFT_266266 [Myriangium duriaei CBS 260.36]|uniref:IPT/TIG domain-containing protein n=1 Tax=Myriangium duriaei CBS 260.36 TaxID=1168546 RepID=A0A9P4J6E5_9PEZI|nr:hypothetical protein K461DRAFT_266266 [Myriangium duriaei CBS 260.36]